MLGKSYCGKATLYDVHLRVNTKTILHDYHKFVYPYRYVARVKYTDKQFERLEHISNFPEYIPNKILGSEEMVYRSLLFFIEKSGIPNNSELSIHATRYLPGKESVDIIKHEWYKTPFQKMGILCIHQENMEEGTFEIKPKNSKDQKDIFSWRIRPSELLILSDGDDILQRYRSFYIGEEGHLDIMKIIY